MSVRVNGGVIGYLAKELAARYAAVLQSLMANGRIPTSSCRVWAYEHEDWQGTDRRGRDVYQRVLDARASLVLDEPHLCVPANLPPTKSHRLLPKGSALQVKGEEKHLDVLAPLVREYGEAWVYTTLHVLTVGSARSEKQVVELRVDGEPIGHLTPAMSSHFVPTIDHLARTEQLAVARTLLKGNPLQVEAVLHAAKSHELDNTWLSASPTRETPSSPPGGLSTRVRVAPVGVPPKPTRIVFQAPPGWPAPPVGWEPTPGWLPEPDWPAPPPGWQFWVLQ